MERSGSRLLSDRGSSDVEHDSLETFSCVPSSMCTGKRHGNGTLWIHEPLAIVLIDTQVIGDDLKLIAGHLKHVIVVDTP